MDYTALLLESQPDDIDVPVIPTSAGDAVKPWLTVTHRC